MKHIFVPLLFLLCLCACGGQTEPAASGNRSAADAALAVLESQGYDEDLSALSEDLMESYLTEQCGLESCLWTDAAVYAAGGIDAREIAVIRLADSGNEDIVTAALENRRQDRIGDFFGYAPEQAALLEQSAVVYTQGFAALLVCEDPAGAEVALTDYLLGETALALTTQASVSAERELALTPELDTDSFLPFNPPNEYDMSLYDASAILTAYAAGDESALSEKDAAILARCREAFAECLTEDMTDFEKELALHDWLMDWGQYDYTVYDLDTPMGREDNTNPYGVLVGGYGICLGYATTLELLLDLAGVECITVVGAAYHSTQDHAWNMVKLEGEWYCVDPTWNLPPFDVSDLSDSQISEIYHQYFNRTSEYMRFYDHQWDYQNVPEATATRFLWKGSGPLPS